MKITDLSHKKLLVSPSILAADFGNLNDEIKRIDNAGADLIHLDVMDGHFVPNISFGSPIIKVVRNASELVFDAHLMISNPLKYIKSFADAGCEHISFHVESDNDPKEVIDAIKKLGCSVGISLKPNTPVSAILEYIKDVDLVLVMTVEPGFGGQSFMADMCPKIVEIKEKIHQLNLPIHIEVDGGIDEKTVAQVAKAGANMMVAGTAVFKHPEGAQVAIDNLHSAQKYINLL